MAMEALVTNGDLSPVAEAGKVTRLTATPEGRLRVDAELSVGDVALSIAEYTEDAAAPANPTGPVTMLVRRDTPVTNEVTAENDIIAWKGTNKGEGRVNDADLAAVAGTTAGAAVITDAAGTIQQYLRGLIAQWISYTLTFASQGHSVAASVTRTNDTNAYTANDVIGAATGSTAALSFANVGRSGGDIMITSAEIEIDAAALISGETSYNLYLYNVTPPSALGDNAAFDIPSGDRASFLGKLSLGTPVDEGSTLYLQTDGINKHVKLAGTGLFAYLVTVGAYTPTASRVHKVTLHTHEL